MNEWMNECMDGWMNEWLNESMHGWMNTWMNEGTYAAHRSFASTKSLRLTDKECHWIWRDAHEEEIARKPVGEILMWQVLVVRLSFCLSREIVSEDSTESQMWYDVMSLVLRPDVETGTNYDSMVTHCLRSIPGVYPFHIPVVNTLSWFFSFLMSS